MLDAVNDERHSKGLASVCYNEKLNEAAQEHSDDMVSGKFLSHTGSDGSKPKDRVEDASYDWRVLAENVAMGQPTVADVMASWMNSAGHRANILHSDVTQFGFAKSGVYWTQVFAHPRGDEVCIEAEPGGGDEEDSDEDPSPSPSTSTSPSPSPSPSPSSDSDEDEDSDEEAEYQCCVFDNFGLSIGCFPEKQWWILWCPDDVE